MIIHHLPFFPEIILGLFAVILGCFSFASWFKSSRVTIDSDGVRTVNRYLFLTRRRRFDAADVARFETSVGMTSGTKVFMDIRLVTRAQAGDFETAKAKYNETGQMPPFQIRAGNSKGVAIASGIASAVEANWLVREMTRALGRGK
jgi:hypothetical protein